MGMSFQHEHENITELSCLARYSYSYSRHFYLYRLISSFDWLSFDFDFFFSSTVLYELPNTSA